MIIITPIIRLVFKIASVIFFILTALCCFGGYISPDVTAVGSVAVLGMPVMVSISALLITIWFFCKGWIISVIGILMLIMCASPIKMWFPLNSPTEPEPDAPTLSVLTWNVLHGRDLEQPNSKNARMLETILALEPDVVCLQELYSFSKNELEKFSQSAVDSLMKIYPYQLGTDGYDLKVLSKYPLRHVNFGTYHQYLLAEYFTVKTPSREIAMANVHLTSYLLTAEQRTILGTGNGKNMIAEKKELSRQIFGKMREVFPERAEAARMILSGMDQFAMPIIICGDFNDVPASWTYRLFLKEGFMDAYTATNFFPTYTYYKNSLYFHLDQICYRGALRPLSVDRIDVRTSDHIPLLAKFQVLSGY